MVKLTTDKSYQDKMFRLMFSSLMWFDIACSDICEKTVEQTPADSLRGYFLISLWIVDLLRRADTVDVAIVCAWKQMERDILTALHVLTEEYNGPCLKDNISYFNVIKTIWNYSQQALRVNLSSVGLFSSWCKILLTFTTLAASQVVCHPAELNF